MKDIYKFEFTAREVTLLMSAVIVAQLQDEQFVKDYPENVELVASLNNTIKDYEVLRVKLRRDYK